MANLLKYFIYTYYGDCRIEANIGVLFKMKCGFIMPEETSDKLYWNIIKEHDNHHDEGHPNRNFIAPSGDDTGVCECDMFDGIILKPVSKQIRKVIF